VTLGHLAWIPVGALVGWLAAFVFGDVLTLPVDLYYLIYFTIVVGFLGYYAKRTGLELGSFTTRRLGWAVGLGVLGGLALMRAVLSRPETEHLSGGMLAWAIAYRGVIYGSVDGLLLFAFPWTVAWRALGAESGWRGARIRASGVAFAAILLITTTYHLGYRDFRNSRIVLPNIGSTIGAVPTLLSGNPVASTISHVLMHVTSVLHSPESDLFLPPHRGETGGAEGDRSPEE